MPRLSSVRLCPVSLLLLLSFLYRLHRLHRLLFVHNVFRVLSVAHYILKSGVPLQSYRPIVTIIIRSGRITSSHAPRIFFAIALCPRRDFLKTCPRASASSTINPDRTWYHTYPGHMPERTPYTCHHQWSLLRIRTDDCCLMRLSNVLEAISRIQREDCSLVRFPNVLKAEDTSM